MKAKMNVETYTREMECIYKEEKYSVRDNGAVMRHPKTGGKARKDDNSWTFGRLNAQNGFLEIGGKRTHQIVASAFLGAAPTSQYVVVHLDTDRRNNCPENLRWVTKFENTLLTPHNCEKIRKSCGGSIEAILQDVTLIRNSTLPASLAWIVQIAQKDALRTFDSLVEIAQVNAQSPFVSLDEWLSRRWENVNRFAVGNTVDRSARTPSLTGNAIQVDWFVPSEFPCCPHGVVDNPIVAYFENLKRGSIFCRNSIYVRHVMDAALSEDKETILVSSIAPEEEAAIKPWALAKITYEGRVFLHHNLGSFFELLGVEKYFQLAQGKEWTGDDSIDDYC